MYSLADGFTDLLYGFDLHLLRRRCAFASSKWYSELDEFRGSGHIFKISIPA
jgi:hypothetical protein